jgi:hypothetical protein
MAYNRFVNPTGRSQIPSQPGQRLGFQDDPNKEVVATRGVKLKNKAAEAKENEKKEREEYMRKFDDRAEKTVKYHQEQSSRTLDIISRFFKMSEDKTLSQNRGSIADDVEREIRQQLIQLGIDINNDDNEEDNGKGSIVILSVVTKIILMYRDRLNSLEYEVQNLKRELKMKESSSISTRQVSDADQRQ